MRHVTSHVPNLMRCQGVLKRFPLISHYQLLYSKPPQLLEVASFLIRFTSTMIHHTLKKKNRHDTFFHAFQAKQIVRLFCGKIGHSFKGHCKQLDRIWFWQHQHLSMGFSALFMPPPKKKHTIGKFFGTRKKYLKTTERHEKSGYG